MNVYNLRERNFRLVLFSLIFPAMMKKNFYDIAPKWNCLKDALKIVYWPLEQKKVRIGQFLSLVERDRKEQRRAFHSFLSSNFPINLRILCVLCAQKTEHTLYSLGFDFVDFFDAKSLCEELVLMQEIGTNYVRRKRLAGLCHWCNIRPSRFGFVPIIIQLLDSKFNAEITKIGLWTSKFRSNENEIQNELQKR